VDFVSNPNITVKVMHTGGGRTLAKVRLSSSAAIGSDGLLTYGNTFDPNRNGNVRAAFSLIDPATGGADVDGRRSVYAQWRDSAGCWSEPVYGRITLDRGGPVGSLSVVGAPTLTETGDVEVLAPATDAGSGVAELALSNDGVTWQSLGLTGEEVFDIAELNDGLRPQQTISVIAKRPDGVEIEFPMTVRIDTPVELDYYRNGGILQTVLRKLLRS